MFAPFYVSFLNKYIYIYISKSGIGKKKNYATSLHFKLVFILAISTTNIQIYTTILNFVDTKRYGKRRICMGQG